MHFDIYVSQEDITTGRRANCYNCPVALAIHRVMKSIYPKEDWLKVSVRHQATVYLNYRTMHIALPDIAQEFISNFDIGWDGKPFIFTISLPE